MYGTYVGSPSTARFQLSRDVLAVLLFCLLGLTVSIAVFSVIPAQDLTFLAY
jgi:hypothetical protein